MRNPRYVYLHGPDCQAREVSFGYLADHAELIRQIVVEYEDYGNGPGYEVLRLWASFKNDWEFSCDFEPDMDAVLRSYLSRSRKLRGVTIDWMGGLGVLPQVPEQPRPLIDVMDIEDPTQAEIEAWLPF